MKEQVIRFGENDRLCGIVAAPDDIRDAGDRPAVVFVSAGLLPKSGPYRMYTEMARSIAALGFVTFRFDLSGNGDSLGAITTESADRTTMEDTRLAIDEITSRYGLDDVVLFGLCSGAEASHKTALTDERVTGIVALDGFIARNLRYYFWHYLPRIFSFEKWRDFLGNRMKRLLNKSNDELYPRDSSVNFWDDEYPRRGQLAADYRKLCERQVRQLLIFSGGAQNCSYRRQFHDVFNDVPLGDLVDVHFFSKSDHTYVLREDRRELLQATCRWFRERYLNRRSAAPARDRALHRRNQDKEVFNTPSFNRTINSAPRRREEI